MLTIARFLRNAPNPGISPPRPSRKNLADRLSPMRDRYRPAGQVGQRHAPVDSEQVIDCRDEVAGRHRMVDGVGADLVARAVDVTRLDASTGQEGKPALGPMVAPRLAVDAR